MTTRVSVKWQLMCGAFVLYIYTILYTLCISRKAPVFINESRFKHVKREREMGFNEVLIVGRGCVCVCLSIMRVADVEQWG